MATKKKKSKHHISSLKSIYLGIIVLLPVYAGFAAQMIPREHEGQFDGARGWPFLVCGPVDSMADLGLLMLNASMIFGGIYILVIFSAIARFHFLGQEADGSKAKKSRAKKSKK